MQSPSRNMSPDVLVNMALCLLDCALDAEVVDY